MERDEPMAAWWVTNYNCDSVYIDCCYKRNKCYEVELREGSHLAGTFVTAS